MCKQDGGQKKGEQISSRLTVVRTTCSSKLINRSDFPARFPFYKTSAAQALLFFSPLSPRSISQRVFQHPSYQDCTILLLALNVSQLLLLYLAEKTTTSLMQCQIKTLVEYFPFQTLLKMVDQWWHLQGANEALKTAPFGEFTKELAWCGKKRQSQFMRVWPVGFFISSKCCKTNLLIYIDWDFKQRTKKLAAISLGILLPQEFNLRNGPFPLVYYPTRPASQ